MGQIIGTLLTPCTTNLDVLGNLSLLGVNSFLAFGWCLVQPQVDGRRVMQGVLDMDDNALVKCYPALSTECLSINDSEISKRGVFLPHLACNLCYALLDLGCGLKCGDLLYRWKTGQSIDIGLLFYSSCDHFLH